MAYTEVQIKGNNKYYYRTKSIRKKDRVMKLRKYMGFNLPKKALKKLEIKADLLLNASLNDLLNGRELLTLERIKKEYSKVKKKNWQNRYESFLSQFTYDSNAIEGNTLSLQETSYVLFEHRAPKGKSLREINEAINHKKAFDYLLEYKGMINKKLICGLQELIVLNALREDLKSQIGKYRDIQVYIRGADFIPPKPHEAKREMGKLLLWYMRNKNNLNPLILAAYFHATFESIHPFVDGNGRTGRLLLNFILHKNNYPMINIPNARRLEYYECLEEARKGNLRKFVKLLFDIMVSTEIYV